jgi:hypothetical protein
MAYQQVTVSHTVVTPIFQTVETTASVNLASGIYPAGNASAPRPIIIENLDTTNPVYIGTDSSVAANTGLTLAHGGTLTFNIIGNEILYGLAGTANVAVAVLAMGC